MIADPKKLLNSLQSRFWHWVEKRRPSANTHRLTRHNLFIFPSKAGFGFLVLVLLLWILGTNYENNLVLGLAFFLTALFIVSILHTFANVRGITVQCLGAEAVFSGELADVKLLIWRTDKCPRDNLIMRWGSGRPSQTDLVAEREVKVTTELPSHGRGWLNPGVLILETYYPLGIIRCWTRLRFDARILVYPHPVNAGPLPQAEAVGEEGELSTQRGADEFSGYKSYVPGDSLKNLAWKQFARGVGLYAKEHVTYLDRRRWIDWALLPGVDTELRLSYLCHWVMQAHNAGDDYGLRLPGVTIPPQGGIVHRDKVLRELALFQLSQSSGGQPS